MQASSRGAVCLSQAIVTLAVIAAGLLAGAAEPGVAEAAPPRPSISASLTAVSGGLIASGRESAHSGRPALQQRLQTGWVNRAVGRASRDGDFILHWTPQRPPSAGTFRVAILSGRQVTASSRTLHLHPSSKTAKVTSRLAPGTVEVPPGSIRVVSGSLQSGSATLKLPAKVRIPPVGDTLVQNVSSSGPGVIAIVTRVKRLRGGRTELVTKRGNLQDAYSSFTVDLNGTLGSLSSRLLVTPPQQSDLSADSGFAGSLHLTPSFSCPDKSAHASVTGTIDLSGIGVSTITQAVPPFLYFSLFGPAQIDLDTKFAGAATCVADLTLEIGIKGTPLSLTIGPRFTLAAQGEVDVQWDWRPFFDFALGGGATVSPWLHTHFNSFGSIKVTGHANLTADFDLLDEIGDDDDGADLKGTIGPEVSVDVNANSNQTCVTATDMMKATESADLFGWSHDFGTLAWGYSTPVPRTCSGTEGGTGGGGGVAGGGGSGGSAGGGSGGSGTTVTLTNPGNQSSTVGNPVSLQIRATDSDGGPLTYSAIGLPAGLSIDPSTGLIAGTPAAAGVAHVTISGNDSTGPSGSINFTWVTAVATPATWSGPIATNLQIGAYVSCGSAGFCVAIGPLGAVSVYDGFSWSIPVDLDNGTHQDSGETVPNALNAVSCASDSFCVAVDDAGNTFEYASGSWMGPTAVGENGAALWSVSCTSSAFCLATDDQGAYYVWDGSVWSAAHLLPSQYGGIGAVSCVSADFCMATHFYSAVGAYGAAVFDGSGWSLTSPTSSGQSPVFTAVSCFGDDACVALDATTGVDDPYSDDSFTYSGGAWNATPATIMAEENAGALSCVSTSFCLEFGSYAQVFNGTTWSANSQPPATTEQFGGVSCVSTIDCIGFDADSNAFTFSSSGWSGPTAVGGWGVVSLACPAVGTCTAGDFMGHALSFASDAWSAPTYVLPGAALQSISCPTTSFCAAVDGGYSAFQIDGVWQPYQTPSVQGALNAVTCLSSSFCIGVGRDGDVSTYDGAAWNTTTITSAPNLVSIACISTAACFAGDSDGNLYTLSSGTWSGPRSIGADGDGAFVSCAGDFCAAVSTTDAAVYNGSSWSAPSSVDPDNGLGFTALSCVASGFCMAGDDNGNVLVYNGTTWSNPTELHDVDGSPTEISGLACASSTFCVAGDPNGYTFDYTNGSTESDSAGGASVLDR